MNRIIFLLSMIILAGCGDGGSDNPGPVTPPDDGKGSVEVYLTSCDRQKLLSEQPALKFKTAMNSFTIQLDTTVRYQEMAGFGAALTGSSAVLLKNMDAAKRTELLRKLFDPVAGVGISYLRLTIGSSDFSLGNYSYCDTPDIDAFDIPQTDRRDLLPVLKEILAIAPDIRIMASPWSAPAWMKGNKSMNGGSLVATDSNYLDFALYFLKYIQAMKAEGITIDAITIQNEPMHETSGYPTMKMEWQEQNLIIRDYLGPLFRANNITTKVLVLDHNWDLANYPINILNDPDTRQYVEGSAFHGYGGSYPSMAGVHNAHPDKSLYFTEQSAGGWGDGFGGDLKWHSEHIFTGTINNWSRNVIMWNLALNSSWGPTNGGCTNCRGVVTIDGNTYSFNEEYYMIGHFSKFVRPGSYRVKNSVTGTTGGQVFYSTFLNADGSKSVFVANTSSSRQNFSVRCGTREFNYIIPVESVVTFKWQ